MWPTWWTIASDQLSDDEDGTIYVVDEVCMLRCTVTMVLFEDGIIRPVFVVWLLEKVSGRERMAALIREQSRPIVRAEQGSSTKGRRVAQGKDAYCANPKELIWGRCACLHALGEGFVIIIWIRIRGPPILCRGRD